MIAKTELVPSALHFEERLRQHLHLDDGAELSKLLHDPRVFAVIAGLLQAFVAPTMPTDVNQVLEMQRERGRRRKQAIPRAVAALIKAAGRYRALEGLERLNPGLADQMEQEAFRLLLQENRWEQLHNEKRLGMGKDWIFLVILEDFVKLWSESLGQPYSLTAADLLRLQIAGECAQGLHLGSNPRLPVPDDLRGLAHFRANPRNSLFCKLAANYAAHLVINLPMRPLLILRDA